MISFLIRGPTQTSQTVRSTSWCMQPPARNPNTHAVVLKNYDVLWTVCEGRVGPRIRKEIIGMDKPAQKQDGPDTVRHMARR